MSMRKIEETKPLISVIVPIYMIDKYLGICIESIMEQTYENLEIILVDDGSRDRCPELCDLYSRKDGRIKVIHKENGGLVSARKAGLRAASGRYVGYVDGDDWIEPGFYESMYRAAAGSGADMVCAGHSRDLFGKSEKVVNACPAGTYEGRRLEELHDSMISYGGYYRPGITTYVWNKLFKREILYGPQMNADDRLSIGEDGAVTYPALLGSRCVRVTENAEYHYRQREDSMLKQSNAFRKDAQKLKLLYEYMKSWAERETRKRGDGCRLLSQARDYVLSICMIRLGGCLAEQGDCGGRRVALYSAGTFGQQLANRIKERGLCEIAVWVDDDYREYRRCCMDVDPVEDIAKDSFDYVLIATVDGGAAEGIARRLVSLGVGREKIRTMREPEDKEELLKRYLDMEELKMEKSGRKEGAAPHA